MSKKIKCECKKSNEVFAINVIKRVGGHIVGNENLVNVCQKCYKEIKALVSPYDQAQDKD